MTQTQARPEDTADLVTAPARPPGRARRMVIAGLLVAGVLGAGLAVRSLWVGGIGWDSMFDTIASHVPDDIDPSETTLEEAYELVPTTSEFYGLFVYRTADLAHGLVTGSSERLSPLDPVTYRYQGLVNIGLSVLAAGAAGTALWRATRSGLVGAFTWAALLTYPLWLGMSQVDFKDMPVASGLTMTSAGLVLAWVESRRLALVGAVVLTAAGASVALASRPASITLIGALLTLSLAAHLVVALLRRDIRRWLPMLVCSVVAVVVALLATWRTNPIAQIDLWQWLADAVDVSRRYPWEGTVRTAGQDLSATDLPLWYSPAWFLAQMPLLTIAAVAFGAGVVIWSAIARRPLTRGTLVAVVPLLVQGTVLPLLIVAGGAVLYDGVRHLLFVVPAIVVVAALGVHALEQTAPAGPSWRGRVAPAVAVVVVLLALFADVRWYPYSYAFVNPVAGIRHDERDWELDYWGVSSREAIDRLRAEGFDVVVVVPSAMPGRPYGAVELAGTVAATGDDEAAQRSARELGLYVFHRGTDLPEGCRVLFTIERDGHELGAGAACTPTVPDG